MDIKHHAYFNNMLTTIHVFLAIAALLNLFEREI